MPSAPYRVAAPPEPEAPGPEEHYAARLRAGVRRGQLLAIGVAVMVAGLAVASITRPKSSPGKAAREQQKTQVDEARIAIDAARTRAMTEQARFEAALRAAATAPMNRAPSEAQPARCAVALPAPASLVRGRAAFPLLVTAADAVAREFLPSPTVGAVLRDVRRAEAHLSAGRHDEAALYARALDKAERFHFDIVLVTSVEKAPAVTNTASYEPGEMAGRVFAYDFAKQRVVCEGEIRAESSRELGYAYKTGPDAPIYLGRTASLEATLEADLRLQTERAIVSSPLWEYGRDAIARGAR